MVASCVFSYQLTAHIALFTQHQLLTVISITIMNHNEIKKFCNPFRVPSSVDL